MSQVLNINSMCDALLDAVADGITAQDKTGKLVYVNQMAAELIGYPTPSALLAASMSEVTERFDVFDEHGQPLPLIELPNRLALRGMDATERVLRFRDRATGEERWSRVRAKPVRDTKGEVAFAVNTFHDITPLKRTQLSLEESETRFRILADYAPVMIWVTGTDRLCTYVNRPWLDFTGRTLAESLGYEWALSIHEEDREHCLNTFIAAFDRQEEFSVEYRLRRYDGEYRWVLDTGIPRYEADGRFVGFIGSCLDISERKQQELNNAFLDNASKILASSLDYQTTLSDIAHLATREVADWCAIDVRNSTGGVERLAVAYRDPTKVERLKELQKRFPLDAEAGSGVSLVLRSGEAAYYLDISDDALAATVADPHRLAFLRQLGICSAIVVPLTMSGETLGAISLVNSKESGRRFTRIDFALAQELARRASVAIENALLYQEVQDACAKAEQADRLKSKFLGVVSHELRTPLTSIKGFASTLLAEDVSFDTAHQREFLTIIDDEATKLAKLVDQLLDISQLFAGTLRINPSKQKLDVVLNAIHAQLEYLTRHHQLVVQWPDDLPELDIDAHRIGQVLVNLVDNAVKFAPASSTVTLTATLDGESVRIDVIDEGPGIPQEDWQSVFEAFRYKRQDSRQRGVGLGLAICKTFVEAHGGKIQIGSPGDRGTLVSFDLPLKGRLARTPTEAQGVP